MLIKYNLNKSLEGDFGLLIIRKKFWILFIKEFELLHCVAFKHIIEVV